MSSDPPPTLPTGVAPPLRCVHGGHPDLCGYCKVDDELAANPELETVKQRSHDFGCPLFVSKAWGDDTFGRATLANYQRIYGGDGKCNCKRDEKKKEK